MDYLASLGEAVAAGRPIALVTVVAAPGREEFLGKHLLFAEDGLVATEVSDPALQGALSALAAEALVSGQAATRTVEGVRAYVEPHLPPPALLVVGAGHVAQPVVHLGKLMSFHVTVIDDRAEYANRSRFPDADAVLCVPFVEGLRSLSPGRRHHIVLVTRGHRYDMDSLREVIERPVAYIGMIGSRTRVETVFRLLEEEYGVDPAHFSKVYAPIGLDVGARTPAEIAVAVAAELLKVRSGGTGESLSRLGHDKIHRRGRGV